MTNYLPSIRIMLLVALVAVVLLALAMTGQPKPVGEEEAICFAIFHCASAPTSLYFA